MNKMIGKKILNDYLEGDGLCALMVSSGQGELAGRWLVWIGGWCMHSSAFNEQTHHNWQD